MAKREFQICARSRYNKTLPGNLVCFVKLNSDLCFYSVTATIMHYWFILDCVIRAPDSTLQWHHNERDVVLNHRRSDCLLDRLFRHWSKETAKFRVTGLGGGGGGGGGGGNSPVTGDFPHKGPLIWKKCFHMMTSLWCNGCALVVVREIHLRCEYSAVVLV